MPGLLDQVAAARRGCSLMRADTYSAFNDPFPPRRNTARSSSSLPRTSKLIPLGQLLMERGVVDKAAAEFRWCRTRPQG